MKSRAVSSAQNEHHIVIGNAPMRLIGVDMNWIECRVVGIWCERWSSANNA